MSIVSKLYNYLATTNSEKFKQLEGKLLTLVDASFVDPQQRKAQKDVIKSIIWQVRSTHDFSMRNWVLLSLAKTIGDKKYLSDWGKKDAMQEYIFFND